MDSTNLVLSDRTYSKLKWTTAIVLPSIATLYFGLSQIWGLPKANEVVGTLAIIATFAGTLLGVSSKAYNSDDAMDGAVGVKALDPDTGIPILGLQLNKMPEDLMNQKTVRLKVDPSASVQ